MKFDHDTICKPVLLRELLFYKSVNEDLKQFTPKYHGRHATICNVYHSIGHNETVILLVFTMYCIIRGCVVLKSYKCSVIIPLIIHDVL